MFPFIRDGDVVTISPLVRNLPRRGEVVAFFFQDKRELSVHRVIAGRDDSCLIKGDNLSETDGWVLRANIVGAAGRVERDGKQVRLGLGPERLLIAFLSRRRLFHVMLKVLQMPRLFLGRKI